MRPLHCTLLGLRPAISPNVGNSGAQFMVVGVCVRAAPVLFLIKSEKKERKEEAGTVCYMWLYSLGETKKIRDSRARAHQKIPPRDFFLVDLIHASHAFVLDFHARSIAPTTRVGRQASCPCSPHVHRKRIHEGHERNRIWRRESIFCRESIF